MRLRAPAYVLFVVLLQAALLAGQTPTGKIAVSAVDQANQPVSGVAIQLKSGTAVMDSAVTDASGRAEFLKLLPGSYRIAAQKEGFEPVEKADLKLATGGSIAMELTMVPTLVHNESIEVHESASPVEEQGAAVPSEIPTQAARELPSRPATVADALPLTPGVVRAPGGGLKISGSGEHRSALIVNSADVTDPATGQFGLTVPIDSVDTLNVFQTPFLAEYGRFTAGLVSVETRRGSDQWKWELNDPFPEFFIHSWHLLGLRDATPRLNFEGPLVPGKLFFSEGFEYTIRKTPVFTLPFPDNEKKEHGVNSFAQLDWIVSGRQWVTASVHVAPQNLEFANIDAFNPPPTSPNDSTRNYTTTVADRLTLAGGLLENTVSATRFDTRVWGQGPLDLTLAPAGNSGNYFAQQDRQASRLGWSSTYSFAPISLAGSHNLKVGSYIAGSSDHGQVSETPINIDDSSGRLLERITFAGGQPFRMTDTEFAFFGQDHWIVSPRVALDLGLRAESQEISEALRLAPRMGVAWSPFTNHATVIRAGFGLFYDRVPLNVYSFENYPNQVITTFSSDGQVSGGPFLFQNVIGELSVRPPFVFQAAAPGNFSPRSATWTVAVEQPVSRFVKLRAAYTQNDGSGLIVLNPVAPDPATNMGAYVLTGDGASRYRQFELTARVQLSSTRQLFFSYVRSRARGNINDFNNYLGTFPVPIIRSDVFGNLPADLPNRFLSWGLLQLPHGFRIAPTFEYRSGFPYVVTDVAQNYVGIPNQNRFPNFLSVDSRISKDFPVSPKYTLRFSVSSYNLTNHFNPEAIHSNIADPAYGLFFGQRGRHFTADFDVIF